MTHSDFDRIEAELGIALPPDYRAVMLAKAEELAAAGEADPSFAESVFLTAEQVIDYNQAERDPEATALAFPDWWKRFFLVGTNGGGDFYCLRLTGDHCVWMIGTDCGDEPKQQYDSLSEYLDAEIKECLDPDPEPSSFTDDLPLSERFHFTWWGEYCTIRPDYADRPLTVDRLREHGIDVAKLEHSVRTVAAALTSCRPEDVQAGEEPGPDDEGLLRIYYRAPALSDPRLLEVTARVYRGYLEANLRLKQETRKKPPAPGNVPVDWEAFRTGVIEVLETMHPPGTRATVSELRPDTEPGPRYEWTYSGHYSLTPS
jgi:SMI1/KNR4 family protein SUKH-1